MPPLSGGWVRPVLLAAVFLVSFFWWQNNGLTLTRINLAHPAAPNEMEPLRILQISDLHNKRSGRGQARLLDLIGQAQPDLIVVTGDLIDARRPGMENALALLRGAQAMAPVFFVSGNHEAGSGQTGDLLAEMERMGVVVLEDRAMEWSIGPETIRLLGLSDPGTAWADRPSFRLEAMDALKSERFQVLLAHRPEWFSEYTAGGVDLVFAGHAHGGQIRLPVVGGLLAPGQGVLPRYSAGVYQEDQGVMVVSRGLGNSLFPLRLMNRPELVLVTLTGEK